MPYYPGISNFKILIQELGTFLVMKKQILTIIIFLGLVSCNSRQTNKIERKDEPTIYNVKDDDIEMNQAIKMANQTLENFNQALLSKKPDFTFFSLKTRFKASKGGEHIWVSEITLKDGKYFGVIANSPESTTEVKIGDTIQIAKDNISDWMYIENNKLRGGYTIKLLRKRMNETERKQFDTENGLIIED